jgi:GT2 family glycosyltransferase/glycosyltransferase involved in cell wall biosynthesis
MPPQSGPSERQHRVSRAEAGAVSVVIVNYRGADDTIDCVSGLRALDWPADRLQIIVVDNASGDGSVPRLRAALPQDVRIIESHVNGGFTGGCNLGAAQSTGEYLAFINNDARPDPGWLAAAVSALKKDAAVGCVASKVLDWEGVNVDFVDAALAWYGMGYKPGAGAPYAGDHEQGADVLFATGSGMVTRRELFTRVGGFDERYFMFYEDVDYGWRLNLLGHRVRYVPDSVVYHKHHASMKSYGAFREWFLLERNALMTLYKNASDEMLARVFPPAMALSVRRGLAIGGVDVSVLDLQHGGGHDESDQVTVTKQSLTGAYAVDAFIDNLPSLTTTRSDLQAQRVRSDRELVPLFGKAIEPAIAQPRYLAGHEALVDAFGIEKLFQARRNVLVVTGDPLSSRMAGPAIRAFHIAETLATEHDVRLYSTTSCAIDDPRFVCGSARLAELPKQVAWADVVIFQGFLLEQAPWIAGTNKIIVVDLYDPIHIEQLEQTRGEEPVARTHHVASTTEALNRQLSRGDFFLCASERQRDFWLGQLAAMGRLNPRTYDADSTLESLVAVVPFGLPDTTPVRTGGAIRNRVPGIGGDDKVILWGGGIYNWFDPLSLIRAVAQLVERHANVRLFFLGGKHPNPAVPAMRVAAEARALSDLLGLTDKFVFFNEGWVDYGERQNYLLDADVGVSTHFHHLETTFAFRTRILDYLWAGLPMVVTAGDAFGSLVADEGLGVRVDERDVPALVAALERCLFDEEFAAQCRANVERVRPQFTWSRTLAPLVEFCRSPMRAPDAATATRLATGQYRRSGSQGAVARNVAYARTRYREGGMKLVVERGVRKARRLLAR